ncbi:SDR family NAD(P)-dependent oxidoreductase [Desulfosudis oleivorans]|uniref:Short-chain dehydrogenase/reductase SDR n=1 Tax=Desulfosudis oleivorans (strain DSM 6200 / JCM 39069 / Hxd3) TaxID=96561 RepID=A8ZY48_DESOH|nr:SDR family oxidoreductase [Desulfosudis oleivorans]ABW67055.1 short-chain dehydrogenase/reductase SDR [Desulfosudis oleivorans Hxd3]
MNLFTDKVFIVTGGASGMGRAVCELLGTRGAILIIADIDGESAEKVAAGITAAGGRATGVFLDTTADETVRRLVDETAAEYGRLDYMFNNAGILIAGEVRDMSDDHWARILDVNFRGVLTGTLAAYRIMVEQGFGHIINTASTAGLVPIPVITAYATTKHAVVGLSISLRPEAAKAGVRVSVVCPGYVSTSIFDKGTVVKGDMAGLLSTMPIKPISPEKAAGYIVRGVAANRGVIVFPFHARFLWALYRMCPAFFGWGSRKVVDDFRKIRDRQ